MRHGGLEVVTRQEISILKADEIMQNLKTAPDLTRWPGRSGLQLAHTFVRGLMNAILGLTILAGFAPSHEWGCKEVSAICGRSTQEGRKWNGQAGAHLSNAARRAGSCYEARDKHSEG
ncbi:hypothetical protein CDAR_620591 [Caerostris darwini]|uniref:Uncharacterized protein n=1 Tax=Caerostris darwini TaxID=1538125 RepID=A0AAV4PV09_9ARAC|nr:hypothetical protein CDAR_620591 [Caerostris darwini]